MTITAALLVDGVRQREDGAIDLVGLVEGFSFPSLPVSVEELLLFLRLALEDSERGHSIRLTFHLIGPDGKERSPENTLSFTVPTMKAHPAPDATLLPQFTLAFHQTGPHRLEIRQEGSLLLSLPLMVYPN
ncbi:MAG: hypothetical protein QM758_08710 [Armatimonas sp.]